MSPLDFIQFTYAGIYFYAALTHGLIGLRSRPRNKIHLSFAALSLTLGIWTLLVFFLNNAVASSSRDGILFWDYLAQPGVNLSIIALYWFIVFYTGSRNRWIPLSLRSCMAES